MSRSDAIRGEDDLRAIFESSCRPGTQLIGVESEKIGVRMPSGDPISYDGRQCGVLRVFEALCERYGWEPLREGQDGAIIALQRSVPGVPGGPPFGNQNLGRQSITLEPGAQLELSGAPLPTVHAVVEELVEHLSELDEVGRACEMRWLGVGFRPLARLDQLPWVRKARYAIMRQHFPTVGTRGLDMMRRTATVQVNIDYHDEVDAMRKLRVGLKLAPLMSAIFANAPFVEGKVGAHLSERVMVWTDTDRDRTGLLAAMWKPDAGFADYIEWALDVPMYMFKRDGETIANTGQTFRRFWQDGYRGHRATHDDWEMHLATLFPEARLKTTIEMRSTDSLPRALLPAVPALWAGLLYDDVALTDVEAMCADWLHDEVEALRVPIARLALAAVFRGKPLRAWAERLLDIAESGLRRRTRLDDQGRDETLHLQSITTCIAAGRCPADDLRDAIADVTDASRRDAMIEACLA
jgi:glutamate--cysteine ligase